MFNSLLFFVLLSKILWRKQFTISMRIIKIKRIIYNKQHHTHYTQLPETWFIFISFFCFSCVCVCVSCSLFFIHSTYQGIRKKGNTLTCTQKHNTQAHISYGNFIEKAPLLSAQPNWIQSNAFLFLFFGSVRVRAKMALLFSFFRLVFQSFCFASTDPDKIMMGRDNTNNNNQKSETDKEKKKEWKKL